MTTRLICPEHVGTAESVWEPWIATLPIDRGQPAEVVVVAPHPDDETLGAGGLIAAAVRRGATVRVVVCSDGEAAYAGPGLGDRRRRELDEALTRLAGPGTLDQVHLGLPDGGLTAHQASLRAALADVASSSTTLVAPWGGDGHPDHEAVGDSALSLVGDVGRVLSYPVWAWHWATPATFHGMTLVRRSLTDETRSAKAAALGCYRSQSDGVAGPAILSQDVLAHFTRRDEVFVVAS